MEAPSPRYIITRAIFLIVAVIVVLSGISFIKKKQRQTAVITDLKSLASDSSYYRQFSPEQAKATLVRAIGLVLEAKQLGIPPEISIDRGLGLEKKMFATDEDREELPLRQALIRTNLRANYENFRKLGYKEDFQTLAALREGKLPALTGGPAVGKPAVAPIIDPKLSPGIDKIIVNLEIRPIEPEGAPPSDVEIAAAKRLARDLADADVIEDPVRDRIIGELTPAVP